MPAFARPARFAGFCLALLASPAGGAVVETGRDDARVSFLGGSGSTESSAGYVVAAHDEARGRFLVVWSGFDADGEDDVVPGLFARFVNERGETLGPTAPVHAGPVFSPPALVRNAALDEYLAVFDSPHASGVDVLALRLDGETGEALAAPVAVQAPGRSGIEPDVALHGAGDEYLVAWSGETADRGTEIVTQRLAAADLAPLGIDDHVVTRIGPDGDDNYAAMAPRVVRNPSAGETLVAFVATPSDGPGQISDHFEIHVQRLAADGTEVGADDQRVSTMGAFDDSGSSAGRCGVAFAPARNRYLVVWEGHRSDGSATFGTEIYSQALDGATAAEIGIDDRRLTDVGPAEDSNQGARDASLAYDAGSDRFVLVALASFFVDATLDGELLAVEVDPHSGAPGVPRVVSRSGGAATPERRALAGSIAAAATGGALLATWHGEDDDGGMIDGEREVFAQALRVGIFGDGFESGTLDAWSGDR
jgi:hypothetical protein